MRIKHNSFYTKLWITRRRRTSFLKIKKITKIIFVIFFILLFAFEAGDGETPTYVPM